jgi:uncharacterized membrane protein
MFAESTAAGAAAVTVLLPSAWFLVVLCSLFGVILCLVRSKDKNQIIVKQQKSANKTQRKLNQTALPLMFSIFCSSQGKNTSWCDHGYMNMGRFWGYCTHYIHVCR